MSEEVFWRNYMYRVNLLCQKNELSNMATDSGSGNIGLRQGSADADPAGKNSQLILSVSHTNILTRD